MHLNPIQILYATPIGILLGYMYVKTRNIWIPIIGHMMHNLSIFFVFYFISEVGLSLPSAMLFIPAIALLVGFTAVLTKVYKMPDKHFAIKSRD